MVVSIGGRGASDRDEMGRLPTRQCLALALLFFIVQDRLQSSREIRLSHPNGGVARDAERLADLFIGPSIGGFEQGMCARKGARVGFACVDEGLERGTVGFGQGDRNEMLHGKLSMVFLQYPIPVNFVLD